MFYGLGIRGYWCIDFPATDVGFWVQGFSVGCLGRACPREFESWAVGASQGGFQGYIRQDKPRKNHPSSVHAFPKSGVAFMGLLIIRIKILGRYSGVPLARETAIYRNPSVLRGSILFGGFWGST